MTAFSAAMREALALTRSGNLRDAARCIQTALRGAPAAEDAADVIDAEFVVVPPDSASATEQSHPSNRARGDAGSPRPQPTDDSSIHAPARFVSGTCANAAGTRDYKLWIPTGGARGKLLIVMLHGCTQSADDFARGTRMNDEAERVGCSVLYPIQSGQANAQRCWQWFDAAHQSRGSGEPALLAGMVQHVASEHGMDQSRIYVAGLSAGGAMALVLSETHPDVFAAVAVHSGLPAGVANNVPSAMAAMAGRGTRPRRRAHPPAQPVPGLVIHGAADRTVVASNGDAVTQQLLDRYAAASGSLVESVVETPTHCIRACRSVDGAPVDEQWTLHAGGHAWSGGDPAGSYTEPNGPDASRGIVEFFLRQRSSVSEVS